MSDVDTTETDVVDETSADDTDNDPQGTEDLGDPGKKALDAMKADRNKFRDDLRGWTRLAKELGVEDAQGLRDLIEQAGKKEPEKPEEQPEPVDVEKVRREAELAALDRANQRILKAEIKAIATGKLADPHDALLFLDLSKFEVDGDGKVDEDEVSDAITDLLKERPYLAAATAKRFQGSADGGARKGPPQPAQLTRDDLKGMSPQQIVDAKNNGQLKNLLGS